MYENFIINVLNMTQENSSVINRILYLKYKIKYY